LLSSLAAETGPVVFVLCGTLPSPSCPSGLSPTVTATWNIASTSAVFSSLFSASDIGLYVNLLTSNNPSGELRANINVQGTTQCIPSQLAAGSALQALTCTLQFGGVPHINASTIPITVTVAQSNSVSSAMPLVVNPSLGTSGSSFSAPTVTVDSLPFAPNSSLCSESATNTLRLLAQSINTIQRQSCAACGCPSSPSITNISAAHPGGSMVTIRGRFFGSAINQVVLNVDISNNRGTNSVSNLCTSINQVDSVNFTAECPAPAGFGTNIQASVSIGGALPLAAPSMLNYALPPVVHSVSSVTRDGGTVTVIGLNFGPNVTQAVQFLVINGGISVICANPVTVENITQMEAFVCSMPSSSSAQAALNVLFDVAISVNSLSNRYPAQFSYIDTPSITSISTGIRTDGRAELTVSGTGFGDVALTRIQDIDLRLQVDPATTLSCQNIRFVSGVSGGATTIACTLPPFMNSASSYNVVFSVRGFRLQTSPSLSASFVSALTFPLLGGSQAVNGVGFGTTSGQQLVVTVSDASRYSASMLVPISSSNMQLIHTTSPASVARSLMTGDVLLLISATSTQSLSTTSVVRFIHSKVLSDSFMLTAMASPRSAALPVEQAFSILTAAIPLPSSDVVYLVQRRPTDSAAVLTSNSTLAYDVGDPVVFMGEVFGGINADAIYYVSSKIGNSSFTVSLSNGGVEVSIPAEFSSPQSGVMAMFSAYSTFISQRSGDTVIAASPSLISINDAVQISGSKRVFYVRSKPTSRSFTLTDTANGVNPILLDDFSALIMAKFVERKCNSVGSITSTAFTCTGFPAFNSNNFVAIPGRYYPAQIVDPESKYTTAVRWTS